MVDVELIYDSDCPNVEEMRVRLKLALARVGLEAQWQEWERSDDKSPDYVRRYGSPTVLIGGKDVAGAFPESGAKCCRVYSDGDGKISGVPLLEVIISALLKAKGRGLASAGVGFAHRSKWRGGLGIFPVIGSVLIPGISCPACWPAYAAFLSSMGLGFINYTPYLFPLMLLCLVVALLSLGFHARGRRGFGPLVLGSASTLIILAGKFIFAWRAVTYGGVVLLVAASIWNLWPRKMADGVCCSDCVPAAAPRTKLEHRQTPKEVSYERQTQN